MLLDQHCSSLLLLKTDFWEEGMLFANLLHTLVLSTSPLGQTHCLLIILYFLKQN